MNCLTWLIIGFFVWIVSTRFFGPLGGIIVFFVAMYLIQQAVSRMTTRQAGGWDVRDVEDLDPLLGLFMALVRQNPEDLREIHAQAALQILHRMTRQMGLSYSAVTERFYHWESQSIPVKDFTLELKDVMPLDLRRQTLQSLMFVSLADGTIDEDEEGILRYISDLFEIPEQQFNRVFQQVKRVTGAQQRRRGRSGRETHTRSEVKEAYETLDLSPDASEEEVKKRYKTMARKYHPDSFSEDSEEAQQLAQEKMMEINRAYRTIREAT